MTDGECIAGMLRAERGGGRAREALRASVCAFEGRVCGIGPWYVVQW